MRERGGECECLCERVRTSSGGGAASVADTGDIPLGRVDIDAAKVRRCATVMCESLPTKKV